jgi:hypothetical protein
MPGSGLRVPGSWHLTDAMEELRIDHALDQSFPQLRCLEATNRHMIRFNLKIT